MMFFQRHILPNFCSATQGTLAVKDQSRYVSVSFHLLGDKELIVLFSPVVNFLIALSLPGTLVLVNRGGCLFIVVNTAKLKFFAHVFLVAVAAHCGRY